MIHGRLPGLRARDIWTFLVFLPHIYYLLVEGLISIHFVCKLLGANGFIFIFECTLLTFQLARPERVEYASSRLGHIDPFTGLLKQAVRFSLILAAREGITDPTNAFAVTFYNMDTCLLSHPCSPVYKASLKPAI